ncbi:hypothetical protein TNCT_267891 [Trichonephila clavata]|uniref:Uncharacterized protein n=1 Tax=Trichonephila clavata TaxID=2740835 RepID=A0A8X6LNM5_TRICU|nr:hypothetical protein TNCT_267891 [Trichonephila clavata]
MPGIKDVKTVKPNMGGKLRIQRQTMIMNIREAFEIFKETYSEAFVGKAVFYKEIPAHILPINDTPQKVFAYVQLTQTVLIFFSLFRNMRQTFHKHTKNF